MINQLPQGLRTIVNLEYQAGNKVIQIGHHWPQSGKINVLLDKQFIAKYPYIPDVKYAEDLDPHNPIEMYFDINTGDCVFCSKEGANKRGNSSRLTQSFHFFLFEPFFLP